VLNDYESIQRKANMAFRHKELSLQIAGARRAQARDLAERLGAFVVAGRAVLDWYDDTQDGGWKDQKSIATLRSMLGELRLADERDARDA
jgi:hypothetical protein